mmetsp:Transcript_18906/g.42681  ORF Transcript_18906/g.42681 Transcript_18906/m.42681 type:complete len:92 (+) Transcript_18906:637-912(+)
MTTNLSLLYANVKCRFVRCAWMSSLVPGASSFLADISDVVTASSKWQLSTPQRVTWHLCDVRSLTAANALMQKSFESYWVKDRHCCRNGKS